MGGEIACRVGGPRRLAAECLYCSRYVARRVTADGVLIHCRWTADDPVADLMRSTSTLAAAHAAMPVPLAAGAARAAGQHHLLILDGDTLHAVVCACRLADAATRSSVGELADQPAVPIPMTCTLADAAAVMLEYDVGALAVAAEDLLVGLLTREDLASAGFDQAHYGRACGLDAVP